MRVVHVDMPRLFTLTVKEFMGEAAEVLERAGHGFEQFDINPNFWKWVLGLSTPHSPGDLFEPLTDGPGGEGMWSALAEARAHLLDVSRLYGMRIGLGGIELARDVLNSSYAMCALVADNFGGGLFSNFFQQVEERLNLRGADVVCFGVEEPEGIFWALHLGAWLRAAGSGAHFCIARHAWENFSLLPHIAELAKNPWFFGIFGSVILYEEELPETLGRLVEAIRTGNWNGLHNIAIKAGDEVRVIEPAAERRTLLRVTKQGYRIAPAYFASMDVPPDRLVYSMGMVRNKCFYKKCTFCVQIAKHISDHAYQEGAEVGRALEACEELRRHGVSMVNFMDEAMRPVDLREFCAGILERNLRIHWVGRMIAAANPSAEILTLMKRAGCVEILFGLETFDRNVSADMGKVSKSHAGAAETAAMVESFLQAGLFVILSMIYEFPTEAADARTQTLESIERLQERSRRIAVIFNRFHLLHESEMYKNPRRFNITSVEERRPENDLQYHFEYACEREVPGATADEVTTMHRLSLGLGAEQYGKQLARHGKALLDIAYFLDYVSVGFRHRARTEKTLLAELCGAASGDSADADHAPRVLTV